MPKTGLFTIVMLMLMGTFMLQSCGNEEIQEELNDEIQLRSDIEVYEQIATVVMYNGEEIRATFTFEEDVETGDWISLQLSDNLLHELNISQDDLDDLIHPLINDENTTASEGDEENCSVVCIEAFPNGGRDFRRCRRGCRWAKAAKWFKDAWDSIKEFV